MSDINKYDYKDLTPFKWFVLENFPFIEADFDAITNYQLFCKVVEYLNKTIESVNNIGNTVEEFTEKFINLKNYVDNYFENLDVQEEINNKLDEMAEDGTLLQLLSNSFVVFNTVNEMLNSSRLKNGMTAYTLGYYQKNDGGAGKYFITSTQEDLNQGFLKLIDVDLYAKLLIDNINILTLGVKTDIEDTTNFQNAIDFCYQKNIECVVPEKTFVINDTLNLYSQHKLHLLNNAKITSSNDIDMISVPCGAMIEGGLIENTSNDYSKSLLLLLGSNYLVANKNGFIKNITLNCTQTSINSNGIRTKYSTGNIGISYFTIDNVFIKNCGTALKITDDENISQNSYFTANLINNLRTFVCNNNIYINTNSECAGNNFKNIQIQPPSPSYNSALFVNSNKYQGAIYNIFEVMVWDTPSNLVPFNFGTNSGNNVIFSYAYNYTSNNSAETRISDLGANNQFLTGLNISYYVNSLEKFTTLDLSNLSNTLAYPVIFENLINCVIDLSNTGGQSLHVKANIVPAQDGYRKPCFDLIMSSYFNSDKKNLVKVENKSNSRFTVFYLVGGFKYNLIDYNAGKSNKNLFNKNNPQIITTSFVDGNNTYQPISVSGVNSIKNGHFIGFSNINIDENTNPS